MRARPPTRSSSPSNPSHRLVAGGAGLAGLCAGLALGMLGPGGGAPATARVAAAPPPAPLVAPPGSAGDARPDARFDPVPARPAAGPEDAPRPGRPRLLFPGGAPRAGEPAPHASALAPAPAGPADAGASTPEGRRRRARELEAEAQLALERGDGPAALDALRALAALGEEGDPTAIDLVKRLSAAVRAGRKIGVTSYDLYRALQSDELVPLLERALEDPTSDPRFRANAVDHLAFSRNADTLPFILSLVEQERDPAVLDQMLGYLDEQSDPAVAATLARALGARATPGERLSIVQALGRLGGDDAAAALERAAAADPSPDVRAAAQVELVAQRPPVTGYLLSDVVAGSQAAAAGLRPGDVLLAYNGVAMTPEVSLGAERDRVPRDATVRATIWRGGRTFDIALRAGQIGVNGRAVTAR